MADQTYALSLPTAEVHRWLRDRARLEAQIREINAKLAALQQLFPSFDLGALTNAEHSAQRAQTIAITSESQWPDLVAAVLAKATGGRSQRWMLEEGKKTALAAKIERSPNGLYNAVARMVGRKELYRDGDRFYLPALWEAIQNGIVNDEPEEMKGENAATAPEAILTLMADGKPRSTTEIVTGLASHPSTATKGRNYIYTALARMVKRGQLLKQGAKFLLPSAANEPLNGISAGGSRASEGLHPSLNLSPPASSKAH